MWTCAALLLMAAGFSQGYICPDGSHCSNTQTCCASKTPGKFACCLYSNAVCCADKVHCCPSGKICNAATVTCVGFGGQDSFPMLKKVEPQEPSYSRSLQTAHLLGRGSETMRPEHSQELEMTLREEEETVQPSKTEAMPCDSRSYCNDGFTCCFTQLGKWWCCPYNPSKCCLDGTHCCPYGYDCGKTTCVKQGLRYPFAPRRALASVPASDIFSKWENQVYEQI